jgi:hypothetical protein
LSHLHIHNEGIQKGIDSCQLEHVSNDGVADDSEIGSSDRVADDSEIGSSDGVADDSEITSSDGLTKNTHLLILAALLLLLVRMEFSYFPLEGKLHNFQRWKGVVGIDIESAEQLLVFLAESVEIALRC